MNRHRNQQLPPHRPITIEQIHAAQRDIAEGYNPFAALSAQGQQALVEVYAKLLEVGRDLQAQQAIASQEE